MKRTFSFCLPMVLLFGAAVFAGDDVNRAFQEARRAICRGEIDTATDLLEKALEQWPKEAKLLGLRGVVRIRKSDYLGGAADIKAAIALTPGDAGRDYQATTKVQLSVAALQHGRKQVAAMLRDRPTMAHFAAETQFLQDWAARKFAGEDFGEPIDWDPTPPLHSDAEHLAPAPGMNAAILLAEESPDGPQEGKPRSFEELWAGAVYELHNVAFARRFVKLHEEADEGRVSKEEFVAGILKYELLAAQQTRAFYVQVYLPWAEKKRLPTNPTLWFCDWWDTPDTVLSSFTDKSGYPWRPYGREHDWATVHRYWRSAEYQQSLKLLKQMSIEEGYEDEASDVWYWIGRCYLKLNQPQEAVEAFSEAIRWEPHNADAYRARGEAYQLLGQKERASADLKKAEELEEEN